MAITSGFFNSVNGDRRYNAAQIGEYLQYIVGSGVFPYVSTSLQVLAADGMTVEVQAGRAMLDHHYMDNDAPISLTLNAGGSQDRIDGIIMYVDMTERACDITIKEGTPAASPKAPAMTRTDVRKEYMLASVYVGKLATAITQSNITDTRQNSAVCGWVSGLIDQVDTHTLFVQWQTAYEEAYAELGDYLAAQKAAWDAFFTAVAEDNLVPVPNVDAIGKAIVVNATGDGYTLQGPDGTLTAQGTAADAAAVGKALRIPNLLDNSDFRNPVNEGGAAVYTGSKETITKWISRSGYSAVTIKEDCVNIKSTNGTTTAYVLQFLEDGKIKSGRKYTVACELKDGSKHCITGEASTSMEEATRYIYVDGAQLGTIRLRYDTTEKKYAVMFSTLSTSGIDVVNVALYEGEYTNETLPIYRPRGYMLEAVICGGGGGGLNFKVVGGTTQPTNPTENTIWVNTGATITGYYFAAEQPDGMKPGEVWISIGTSSAIAFNALKKNSIMVYPISAKQMLTDGTLVDVTAKSRQNGQWVEWVQELVVLENDTLYIGQWNKGSGSSQFTNGTINAIQNSGTGNSGWIDEKISTTNHSKLLIRCSIPSIYTKFNFGLASKTLAGLTQYTQQIAALAAYSEIGAVNGNYQTYELSLDTLPPGEYYLTIVAVASYTIDYIALI